MYYQVSFEEEMKQVQLACDYYFEQAQTIAVSGNIYSESVTHYYRKLIGTPTNVLRFRALFFAMRLQPALTFVNQFIAEYHHAPIFLDIGCRFGLETILIAMAGATVLGIDPEGSAIDEAEKLKTNFEQQKNIKLSIRYEKANLFTFVPDQLYDAIYSSATMHHIEPADKACAAVAKLIKPGGYFFLSDENGFSPVQQLEVQRRIGWTRPRTYWQTDSETGEQFLYGNEDIRPPFIWSRHLQRAGLQPRSIKYCRFVPPVGWSLEQLVRFERRARNVPLFAQLWAIGFMLTTQRT